MMRNARSRTRHAFGRLAIAALAVALPSAALAAEGSPIPHELSPLAMFLAADVVVKGVMIGLAAASVATWTVLIAKTIELGLARRRLARAVETLTSEATMAEAAQHLDRKARIGRVLIEAAAEELSNRPIPATKPASRSGSPRASRGSRFRLPRR
jgi:Biopolymer transport proteins